MDNLVFDNFLVVNQIAIDKSWLTCGKCARWLTPVRTQGDVNYCGACASADDNQPCNTQLAQLLQGFKYPCINKGCDMVVEYNELLQHAESCQMGRCMTCDLCGKICSVFDYIQHLTSEHAVEIVKAEDAVVNLQLNLVPKTESKYVVEISRTQLLLVCKQIKNFLYISFCKDKYDDIGDEIYTVHLKMDKETIENGVVYQGKLVELANSTLSNWKTAQAAMKIYVGSKTISNCTLSVHIGEQHKHTLLHECPICLEPCGHQVCQCDNGHIVCNTCGPKITSCPTCRQNMHSIVFNLKHISPDLLRPCANIKHGCLAYRDINDLEEHLKVCTYRSVKYCECQQTIPIRDVIAHLQSVHKFESNFSVATIDITNGPLEYEVYILFDHHIFRCRITATADSIDCEFKFYCNDSCSQNYRCDVHILDDDSAKTARIVLSEVMYKSNNLYSISSTNRKKFHCKDESKIVFRLCLFNQKTESHCNLSLR